MVLKKNFIRHGWLALLLLVLGSNIALYHTTFGVNILPENTNGVVIGSMFDLVLVSPILLIAWLRKWNWKLFIVTMASGLILVRFFIPMEFLAPFEAVTWIGFAIEGFLISLEILLIATLFKYLPGIIHSVKKNPLPVIFSFTDAVHEKVNDVPIIRVICSEILMFYYAFASWRKKPTVNNHNFTLHQKSSLVALQLMLVHAIIFETIGIHWWLHDKSLILSAVLLILNIYSVILLVADIQAVRLNPLRVTGKRMYISLGLMKRMKISWSDIEEVIEEPKILQKKPPKDTIEFIARDFEQVQPDVILKLKYPVEATLIMGIKKKYNQVAIRVDDPEKFKSVVKEKLSK
ncbi:beta-carotene 15,15'-monooxygenase [Virgibacillus profundi]|uniref:Beta-carotene 15,15'-monooxygenase n=1 Tax=Virgibacillus profundi TaxID=2024555 RepID=A0A2A2IHC6_9BACI|nr:beta-carotene 15,15'-monooxygenase [Virgibacillus profundi]PAV30922.1 beta-carotene 15,15'-monooxygenase [Virgibacillus profundi]PXY55107.1 beta-carotene 15,15'-monooxygenase [Virgibacillus profundi]